MARYRYYQSLCCPTWADLWVTQHYAQLNRVFVPNHILVLGYFSIWNSLTFAVIHQFGSIWCQNYRTRSFASKKRIFQLRWRHLLEKLSSLLPSPFGMLDYYRRTWPWTFLWASLRRSLYFGRTAFVQVMLAFFQQYCYVAMLFQGRECYDCYYFFFRYSNQNVSAIFYLQNLPLGPPSR